MTTTGSAPDSPSAGIRLRPNTGDASIQPIARGVISVTERQSYILRVRELAKACGEAWLATEGGGAS